MQRMLLDPERVRRRAEAEAKLAEGRLAKDDEDAGTREAEQALEVAALGLREAELAERRVREECAETEAAVKKTAERREECERRTLAFRADKEEAEARFRRQMDALVAAQHEEKMIEKKEMLTRHDEQRVRARIATREQVCSLLALLVQNNTY